MASGGLRSAGDSGKEDGNYYIIIGYILGTYRGQIMENMMETTLNPKP